MNELLFFQYIKANFPGLAKLFVADAIASGRYLFLRMLSQELSLDGTWESLSTINRRIAADVIAMDSPLPLKSRPKIQQATGEIPKVGLSLHLKERQLKRLQTLELQARAATTPESAATLRKQVIKGVFDDMNTCITAVFERLEFMFLQSLSVGATVSDATNNTGLSVRIDQGYVTANKFDSTTAWGQNGATPYADLKRVVDAASDKGESFALIMMNRTSLDIFAADPAAQASFAAAGGIFTTASTGTLTDEQINTLFGARFGGAKLLLVNKTTVIENTDGSTTNLKPWADGAIVFLASEQAGTLAYSYSVEYTERDKATEYTEPNDFILVKKWQERNPIKVWTGAETFAIPVLQNVDSIYHLDTLKTLA